MADGFVFQPSYYASMSNLPDADRLALYDALCRYGLYGEVPEDLPPIANGFFMLMQPTVDASKKRYATSVENGKKGGAPKGNHNAKKQPKNNLKTTEEQPKNNLNINNNKNIDIDINKDIDIEVVNNADKPQRKRFSPPSVDEVREYCNERGNNVDPEKFVDYYTANGWMAGKNKMKDWRAAVRTWERNGFDKRSDLKNGSTKGNDLADAASKWSGSGFCTGITL